MDENGQQVTQLDEVEALKARYQAGEISEDEVDREIRRIAAERAGVAGGDPYGFGAIADAADLAEELKAPPIPLGRFVFALKAFSEAYLNYQEASRGR